MADNLQKRPSKGILKNSSSFDKQEVHSLAKKSKEATFDEMNIIATLHPPDKDYGHMKIDEPKTPYNFEQEEFDELDANALAEKIKLAAEKPPKFLQPSPEEDSDDDDDSDLTEEERQKRKEFRQRRKKHYNEFYAVKLARKLLEEEDEDEDEDDIDNNSPTRNVESNNSSQLQNNRQTSSSPTCNRNFQGSSKSSN